MMSLQQIARATGGVVSAGGVNAPGPGHKQSDRSLRIFPDAHNPEEFKVHSFAGDDPITCKDFVRQKLGLAAWQPSRPHVNGHTNGHDKANGAAAPATAPAVVEAMAIEAPAQVDAPGANLPPRTPPDADGKPKFFPWGDDGPTPRDELRRHVYKRDGSPVRIKVKQAGGYVQWFRVCSGGATGWQAKKPDGYVSVPYLGAIDPFDSELAGDPIHWRLSLKIPIEFASEGSTGLDRSE